MVNKITGVDNLAERGRMALMCDCKMFYHQLQCLHVWVVLHYEGKIDLVEVCKELPKRTKRSKVRLTVAPLLGNICAKCEGEVVKGGVQNEGGVEVGEREMGRGRRGVLWEGIWRRSAWRDKWGRRVGAVGAVGAGAAAAEVRCCREEVALRMSFPTILTAISNLIAHI